MHLPIPHTCVRRTHTQSQAQSAPEALPANTAHRLASDTPPTEHTAYMHRLPSDRAGS